MADFDDFDIDDLLSEATPSKAKEPAKPAATKKAIDDEFDFDDTAPAGSTMGSTAQSNFDALLSGQRPSSSGGQAQTVETTAVEAKGDDEDDEFRYSYKPSRPNTTDTAHKKKDPGQLLAEFDRPSSSPEPTAVAKPGVQQLLNTTSKSDSFRLSSEAVSASEKAKEQLSKSTEDWLDDDLLKPKLLRKQKSEERPPKADASKLFNIPPVADVVTKPISRRNSIDKVDDELLLPSTPEKPPTRRGLKATVDDSIDDWFSDLPQSKAKVAADNIDRPKTAAAVAVPPASTSVDKKSRAIDQRDAFAQQVKAEEEVALKATVKLDRPKSTPQPIAAAPANDGMRGGESVATEVYHSTQIDHLSQMMELKSSNFEERISLVKLNYEAEIGTLKAFAHRRETELNELLERSLAEKAQLVDKYEKQKLDAMTTFEEEKLKLFDQHKNERDQLVREHKEFIGRMTADHFAVLDSLQKNKHQELDFVGSASTSANIFENILRQIHDNGMKLGHLSDRLGLEHDSITQTHGTLQQTYEMKLKNMEDLLQHERSDLRDERASLNQLLKRLEMQLNDQMKINEKLKWELNEKEMRLVAFEQTVRDRYEAVAAEKDSLATGREANLREQQAAMMLLYQERQKLADDQEKLLKEKRFHEAKLLEFREIEVKLKSQKDTSSILQQNREADVNRLEEDLKRRMDKLSNDERAFEITKAEMKAAFDNLNKERDRLQKRESEIAAERLKYEKVKDESQRLTDGFDERRAELKQQEEKIEGHRSQLVREKQRMLNERKHLTQLRNSIVCTTCRTPVRDDRQLHAADTDHIMSEIRQLATDMRSHTRTQPNPLRNSTAGLNLKKEAELIDMLSSLRSYDKSS